MYVKGKYSWLKHLDFMFIDVVGLIISFVISYRMKFSNFKWVNSEEWILLLILICLIDFAISIITSRYSGVIKKRLYEDIVSSFKYTLYNVASVCIIFYIFKTGEIFSREMLLTMYCLHYVIGTALRYVWRKILFRRNNKNKKPLYLICGKDDINEVANIILEGMAQYEICGNAEDDSFIEEVLKNNVQDVLIMIDPYKISRETYDVLLSNGIRIHMGIEAITGFMPEDQVISKVGGYKTLSIGMYSFTPKQAMYLSIKRVFDIFCGVFGLIILLPLSLIIKVAYLSNGDNKSIFYTQERVGKNGNIIQIYKFRSMVSNADEILEELLKDENYRKEWEMNQKFENDPRITPIGRFLRKTSLDEIPQLINVLRGEMSLVGPRPLVKGELEMHNGLKLYNRVKPGITGWWGCNGRSNLEYRERLELEYYYVKNCSLYLDIVCILKTVFAVLKRDGSK